uniref:Cytochrome c oxidase subunit 2 n=2 Tax=Culicoides wadai TaxID=469754 RepID=A8B0R9_9DIPT|nr:cytochrome c oxidase subunit II [Culicoides wadai]
MATWSNINIMDSNSPMMEQLNCFHDHTLMILLTITIFISYVMTLTLFNKFTNRYLLSGQTIEMVWTIIPALILFFIALPSLRILYLLDETMKPSLSIKTIGHQWYWSYEYSDFNDIEFDSYMIPSAEAGLDNFRLLDVDNRLILPNNSQIRLIVTALDVIHSWTIPSLGVKVDATPGRLNQTNLYIFRSGLYFGQCSEICGVNHSFMPIVIEAVPTKSFLKWINNYNN